MNVSTFLFMSEPMPDPAAVGAAIEVAPEGIVGESDGGFSTVMKHVAGGEETETVPAPEHIAIARTAEQPVASDEANSGDAVVEGAGKLGLDTPGMGHLTGRGCGLEAILQIIAGASPSDVIVVKGTSPEADSAIPIGESRGDAVPSDAKGTTPVTNRSLNGPASFKASRPTGNPIVGTQMETLLPEAKTPDGSTELKNSESTDRSRAPIVVQTKSAAATGDPIIVKEMNTDGRGELRQINTMDSKGAMETERTVVPGGRLVSGDAVSAARLQGETVVRAEVRDANSTVARIEPSGLKDGAAKSSVGETVVRDAIVKPDRRVASAVSGAERVITEGSFETKTARPAVIHATDSTRTEDAVGNSTAAKGRDGFARAASDIRSIRFTETVVQAEKGEVTAGDKSNTRIPEMKFTEVRAEISGEKMDTVGVKRETTAAETKTDAVGVKRETTATETKTDAVGVKRETTVAETKTDAVGVKRETTVAETKTDAVGVKRETMAAETKTDAVGVKRETTAAETKTDAVGVKRETTAAETKTDAVGMKRKTPKPFSDSKPLKSAGTIVGQKTVSDQETSRVVSKPVVNRVDRVVERVVSTPVQQMAGVGATVSEEVRVDVKRTTPSIGNAEAAKPGDAPVVTEERVITRVKHVAVPVLRETGVEKPTVPDERSAEAKPVERGVPAKKAETPAGTAARIDAKTDLSAGLPVKAEAATQTGQKQGTDLPADLSAEGFAKAEVVAKAGFSIDGTVPVRAAVPEARSESVTPEIRALRESVLEQISNGTRSLAKEGAKEVEISLDPPELGKLKLKITVVGNSIRGLIEVESQAVKTALQSDLPRLSAALAESGLDLGRFDVHVADDRNRGGGREYEQLPGRSSRDTEEKKPEEGERREQPRQRSGNRVVDYWM